MKVFNFQARVHVERSIKHIKDYKIMRGRVSRQLLGRISDIAYVCGMLTNLQPANIAEIRGNLAELILSPIDQLQQTDNREPEGSTT